MNNLILLRILNYQFPPFSKDSSWGKTTIELLLSLCAFLGNSFADDFYSRGDLFFLHLWQQKITFKLPNWP